MIHIRRQTPLPAVLFLVLSHPVLSTLSKINVLKGFHSYAIEEPFLFPQIFFCAKNFKEIFPLKECFVKLKIQRILKVLYPSMPIKNLF